MIRAMRKKSPRSLMHVEPYTVVCEAHFRKFDLQRFYSAYQDAVAEYPALPELDFATAKVFWVPANTFSYRIWWNRGQGNSGQAWIRFPYPISDTNDSGVPSTTAPVRQANPPKTVASPAGAVGLVPSLRQVTEFLEELGCGGVPERAQQFFNHYQARGWRASGKPIRSWKALLKTWKSRWEAQETSAPKMSASVQSLGTVSEHPNGGDA